MAIKMLVITLTLFIVSTTVNAITPICSPAKDKARCSKMTKDAPTWDQAMYNGLNYELAVVKSGQSTVYGIGSKLPMNLEPNKKQDIIDTCNKLYNDIIENLKKATGFIKKDPYPNALQGAIETSYFQGCIDEIREVALIDTPVDVANFANEIANNTDVLDDLFYSRPKV